MNNDNGDKEVFANDIINTPPGGDSAQARVIPLDPLALTFFAELTRQELTLKAMLQGIDFARASYLGCLLHSLQIPPGGNWQLSSDGKSLVGGQ